MKKHRDKIPFCCMVKGDVPCVYCGFKICKGCREEDNSEHYWGGMCRLRPEEDLKRQLDQI